MERTWGPDTAQQLSKFFPKRAPGLQGFVGVTYSPEQIFRQFFSVAADLICCNTNINAEKEQSKGIKFAWEVCRPFDLFGITETAESSRLLEAGLAP